MLEVYILSFNRGEFLENCYLSVKRHIKDAQITVFDDNSNDLQTKKVLKKISDDGTRIILSSFDKSKSVSKVGGLNQNLNEILSEIAVNNEILVIEDDMQIVRDVTITDVRNIESFFQYYPKSICLYVSFLKDEQSIFTYNIKKSYYYLPGNEQSKNSTNFSYPGIWNIKLFRSSGLILDNNMDYNRLNIKKKFGDMAIYVYPFMMYLPFPKSIKFSQKSLIRDLVEKMDGFGFHPYNESNLCGMDYLFKRNVRELPLMKNYVLNNFHKKEKNLYFGDALYRKSKVIWRLYRIELKLRTIVYKYLNFP